MTIHIDKVKFDSWSHLIIQVEVLEVEEPLIDDPDFNEIIQPSTDMSPGYFESVKTHFR